jgi:TonB family protein
VRPIYPKLAVEGRIHGEVVLRAGIDENGKVERLDLVSGHPLLVEAAFDAVKEWRWRPTMLDRVPIPMVTMFSVVFSVGFDDPPLISSSIRGAEWVYVKIARLPCTPSFLPACE